MALCRHMVLRLRGCVSDTARALCTPSSLPQSAEYASSNTDADDAYDTPKNGKQEFTDLRNRLSKISAINSPRTPSLKPTQSKPLKMPSPSPSEPPQNVSGDVAHIAGPTMDDVLAMRQEELNIRKEHFKSPFSERLKNISSSNTEEYPEAQKNTSQEYKPRVQGHHQIPTGDSVRSRDEHFDDESSGNFQNRQGKYNYGLSGLGKKTPKFSRDKSWGAPSVEGEVIFGVFPCLVALQEGRRQVYNIFMQTQQGSSIGHAIGDIAALAKTQGLRVQYTGRGALSELSQSRPHQGVCMDVSPIVYDAVDPSDLDLQTSDERKIWVVLDKVQDPMNFGAILRTCYFMGVDKVITSASHSCALSPVVSKASAGALEVLPMHAVADLPSFLQMARNQGWDVVGTSPEKPTGPAAAASASVTALHQFALTNNTIVVLGNEGRGLDMNMLSVCNHLISIPSRRKLNTNIDSLNVSVATGVLLQHLISSA